MTISDSSEVVNAGKNIVTAGLAVQLASFAIYIFIALCLQFQEQFGLRDSAMAHKIFYGIHGSMIMLTIRTIYRLIQFQSGPTGYCTLNEWWVLWLLREVASN